MISSGISETARHVADSALEFGRNMGGVKRARVMRDRGTQLDANVWQQIAALGWIGMQVSEERGGLGMEAEALAALLESAGSVLLPEPILPAIAAARLLSECTTPAAESLLAQLVAGEVLCLPVQAHQTDRSADAVAQLTRVPDCHATARLLVASGAGKTFKIRLLENDASGLHVASNPCVDGSTLSTCTISKKAWSAAPVIGSGVAVQTAFERAGDSMLLGYSAYLVGLMHEALQLALDYMKVRSQFGTQIGAFQALQHRAASCHVDILASRALVYETARAFDTPARARAAAIAKARTSAAALRVTKECVQFHGAIGFTDEHDIGLFLRKAMAISARHGGEAKQKTRLAELLYGPVPDSTIAC